MSSDPRRMSDVVEACADALLCAAAASLGGEQVDVHDVMARAQDALLRVLDRTMREGPRPR
jgi:hypothetical protein